ncbi:MAG TPA: hypothetical protein VHW43_08325 [Puia sp.]|jgi:hypothetical protein|nr:hypothetical protein [Puia sp.]
MRLKLLITAGLVLFLSTFASPNECARYSGQCGGHPVKQAKRTQPARPASTAVTADTEASTLVINKLLYI